MPRWDHIEPNNVHRTNLVLERKFHGVVVLIND